MIKILLLPILACTLCFADIVFEREAITATILGCDTLEIRGVYHFVNRDTSVMETSILYPLPVDSLLEYPYFITVKRLSNHQQVPFEKRNDGVTWNQIIPPRSADSIMVTYRQKALQRKGRYILTTTQYWGKPLEQAIFTVITPAAITLSYWSFQSDSVTMRKGRIHYHAVKTDFLPDNDMLLEWNCGKNR